MPLAPPHHSGGRSNPVATVVSFPPIDVPPVAYTHYDDDGDHHHDSSSLVVVSYYYHPHWCRDDPPSVFVAVGRDDDDDDDSDRPEPNGRGGPIHHGPVRRSLDTPESTGGAVPGGHHHRRPGSVETGTWPSVRQSGAGPSRPVRPYHNHPIPNLVGYTTPNIAF